MTKETKSILLYLILFGTIFTVNSIIKITIHPVHVNDPIYYRSGACIILIFLLGYILYTWKSDIPELRRRFVRSIPFALMFSVFAKILGIGNFWSIAYGIVLYVMLLFKTSNWKQHFLAILILAFLSIAFFKFFIPFHESLDTSFAKTALLFASMTPLLSFFTLYLSKLLEYDQSPDLKIILIRSIKYSIAASLFFAASLFLSDAGDKLHLDLPIRLLLGTLASISFFVICYKYDLFLEIWKKDPKKKRIDEIRNELNEFYLEERAKVKGKIKE